jgi:hypothetical protein
MLAHAGTPDESIGVGMVVAGLWIGWIASNRIREKGFPRLPLFLAWAGVSLSLILLVGGFIVPRRLVKPPALASGPRPASTATIAITQPSPGSTQMGDEMEVVLDLRGGTIVDTASTTLTPDTGHVHVSLDGKVMSMTYGLVQPMDLRSVAAGVHTLEAEFVAADHGPFAPRVTTSVTFTKASSG